MLNAMIGSWRISTLWVGTFLILLSAEVSVQADAKPLFRFSALAQAAVPQEQQKEPLSAEDQYALHTERAQRFIDAHKPQDAILELEAASAINPNHVEVEADLGVLLFYNGSMHEALLHLKRAMQMRPDLAKVRALLGLAEANSGEPADALKDIEAALPAITETKIKLQAGLELVSLYTELGREQEAFGVLTDLRRIAPDDPRVLFAAYNIYADLSREAIFALALADPNSAQFQQMLGRELIREGKPEGAIAHYKKALAIDPHLPGGHFDLAEVLVQSQDQATTNEAEHQYEEALKEDPEDEKCMRRLGELLSRRGDQVDALAKFRTALALAPNDSDAQEDLAASLMQTQQLNEAQRLLEKSAEAEPTDPTVHWRLATLYRQQGRRAEAANQIKLYKRYKSLKDDLRSRLQELMLTPLVDLRDEQLETQPGTR